MIQTVRSAGAGDSGGLADPKLVFGRVYCNECSERVSRLARVAKNALTNADFPRLVRLLKQMGVDLESADPSEIDADPAEEIRYSTRPKKGGKRGPRYPRSHPIFWFEPDE
jgi:hypothetical protein